MPFDTRVKINFKNIFICFYKALIGRVIDNTLIQFIFLLVELFRKFRRYIERKEKKDLIVKTIKRNNKTRMESKTKYYSEIKNKLKRLRFPWWTKIIAYLISVVIMIISASLVIIKGIDLAIKYVLNG